ncbi:hypothetical protein HDU76_006073 [Blyttiomyces sp. JEL0837]|nr:hypothetical protein HDU76_006073 [Blyttiomyces sp. JEL0837]
MISGLDPSDLTRGTGTEKKPRPLDKISSRVDTVIDWVAQKDPNFKAGADTEVDIDGNDETAGIEHSPTYTRKKTSSSLPPGTVTSGSEYNTAIKHGRNRNESKMSQQTQVQIVTPAPVHPPPTLEEILISDQESRMDSTLCDYLATALATILALSFPAVFDGANDSTSLLRSGVLIIISFVMEGFMDYFERRAGLDTYTVSIPDVKVMAHLTLLSVMVMLAALVGAQHIYSIN